MYIYVYTTTLSKYIYVYIYLYIYICIYIFIHIFNPQVRAATAFRERSIRRAAPPIEPVTSDRQLKASREGSK